jgi:hypothetical protein
MTWRREVWQNEPLPSSEEDDADAELRASICRGVEDTDSDLVTEREETGDRLAGVVAPAVVPQDSCHVLKDYHIGAQPLNLGERDGHFVCARVSGSAVVVETREWLAAR